MAKSRSSSSTSSAGGWGGMAAAGPFGGGGGGGGFRSGSGAAVASRGAGLGSSVSRVAISGGGGFRSGSGARAPSLGVAAAAGMPASMASHVAHQLSGGMVQQAGFSPGRQPAQPTPNYGDPNRVYGAPGTMDQMAHPPSSLYGPPRTQWSPPAPTQRPNAYGQMPGRAGVNTANNPGNPNAAGYNGGVPMAHPNMIQTMQQNLRDYHNFKQDLNKNFLSNPNNMDMGLERNFKDYQSKQFQGLNNQMNGVPNFATGIAFHPGQAAPTTTPQINRAPPDVLNQLRGLLGPQEPALTGPAVTQGDGRFGLSFPNAPRATRGPDGTISGGINPSINMPTAPAAPSPDFGNTINRLLGISAAGAATMPAGPARISNPGALGNAAYSAKAMRGLAPPETRAMPPGVAGGFRANSGANVPSSGIFSPAPRAAAGTYFSPTATQQSALSNTRMSVPPSQIASIQRQRGLADLGISNLPTFRGDPQGFQTTADAGGLQAFHQTPGLTAASVPSPSYAAYLQAIASTQRLSEQVLARRDALSANSVRPSFPGMAPTQQPSSSLDPSQTAQARNMMFPGPPPGLTTPVNPNRPDTFAALDRLAPTSASMVASALPDMGHVYGLPDQPGALDAPPTPARAPVDTLTPFDRVVSMQDAPSAQAMPTIASRPGIVASADLPASPYRPMRDVPDPVSQEILPSGGNLFGSMFGSSTTPINLLNNGHGGGGVGLASNAPNVPTSATAAAPPIKLRRWGDDWGLNASLDPDWARRVYQWQLGDMRGAI